MVHRKRKPHAKNDKEEVPNKKRKVQTNTPTKSTTNNHANFRKKHHTNHQTSTIKQIVEDKEEEYSTNEIILNLNIRRLQKWQGRTDQISESCHSDKGTSCNLITRNRNAKSEMLLKAKIEGYRVITTTNKESKRKGLMILVSKNYKANEKKARKIKNQKWNQQRLRGTSRETLRQTIQIWSLYCPSHTS